MLQCTYNSLLIFYIVATQSSELNRFIELIEGGGTETIEGTTDKSQREEQSGRVPFKYFEISCTVRQDYLHNPSRNGAQWNYKTAER